MTPTKFLFLLPLSMLLTACSPSLKAVPATPQPTPIASSSAIPTMKQLTAADAITLVSQQSEVKAWLALFTGPGQTSPATKGKPVIVEEGTHNGEFTIHVYEQTPDHTAMFNMYYVNLKTGAIKKEFN